MHKMEIQIYYLVTEIIWKYSLEKNESLGVGIPWVMVHDAYEILKCSLFSV